LGDGHHPTHPGDQERDQAARDGGRDQYAKAVPSRKKPGRDGAEQRQASCEGDDDGDDRGGRGQCGQHGCLCELSGAKRPAPVQRLEIVSPPNVLWRLDPVHFSILPASPGRL
jgi:hypothetical protein